MRIGYFIRRIPRIPHALYVRLRDLIEDYILPLPSIGRLFLLNRYGRLPITQPAGPVVSLTTHGRRIYTVYLAIESIGRGEALPSRIILWLDDQALFENLPAPICRLMQRGLEVKSCKNYGPHTKYYPYVETEENFHVPLVIADDDQLYPRYWLDRLTEAFRESPHTVNCHWAVVITLNGEGIGKYRSWKRRATTEPRFRHLALGVSGVIYPPAFLEVLKKAGSAFQDCSPKADDFWLHVQALRAGYKTRQIRTRNLESLQIIGTQNIGLWRENDLGGNNDRQIKATYTDQDLKVLLTE